MQLILGHHRLHGWNLGDLLPLGLRIVPLQGMLAVLTALGLDGDDHVYLLDRHQAPRMSLVSRLPSRPTPGGPAPQPLDERLRRIA